MLTRRLKNLWERLNGSCVNASADLEFQAEIDEHVRLLAERYRRQGLSPDEALGAARRQFGNATLLEENRRVMKTLPALETFRNDVAYAARMLRKNPGFATAAVVTLALGIGANTAMFTVINAVLLRPLSYAAPSQLVTWRYNESLLDVNDIRVQGASLFSAGGAVNAEVMDYTGGAEPLEVHAGFVDAGFFNVFGVMPALGRMFLPEEDRQGGPRAVVLANSFWRKKFSSDPNILGKTIPLSGNGYTVIGVMPPDFAAPETDLDVFVPLRVVYPEAAAYRGVHFMRAYWRLRPGISLTKATAGMKAIDSWLGVTYPAEDKNRHTVPLALQEWITGDVRPALWILFGAVCLVLLIACANFASLLMAHSASRSREMAVRAALGGSAGRLVRQALTESTLLAVLGGLAGLLVAKAGIRLLIAAKPPALAYFENISIAPAVLILTFTVALLTGLVFGLLPARSASRPDVAGTLKQEVRTATVGTVRQDFRRFLVMGEMAMALVLLIGAGLLIKTFLHVRSVDPGFNPANLVSIYVHLRSDRFSEIPVQTAFRRELLARLNSAPGVQAALISDLPLTGSQLTHSLAFEGRPPLPPGDEPQVDTFCVMGDYFRLMQIPLRGGSDLTGADREDQPLVAVINEALSRRYFRGQNPIGHRIRWARDQGPPRWMTIVGVTADVKQASLTRAAFPAVFTPFAQTNEAWRRWMSVVVRMAGVSDHQIRDVKSRIWSLDPAIPLNRMETMAQLLRLSLAERRFNMFLLAVFAALATVLSGVGIYGVMSYGIAQRTHEFGIRMAVGARGIDVLLLVLKEGAGLAAVGLSAGVLGAIALARFVKTLLFGVAPNDPAILIGVVLLMLAVALAACLIPARRATKVDPLIALRHD